MSAFLGLRCAARQAYNAAVTRHKMQQSVFFGRQAAITPAEVSVANGGSQLRAVWKKESEAEPSVYHAVWLRHNCHCPRCLSRDNLIEVQTQELDPQLKISDLKLKDGDVKIKWSCGHEGHLNLEWLKKHCYSQKSLEQRRKDSHPTLPKQQVVLPIMNSKELEDEKGVLRWLKYLNDCGMCLLTDIPCTIEGGMELTQKVAPHLQETFYGGCTIIKVYENPLNISYGPNLLEPHMDIPMYESHPGLNFLQCIRTDECVEGGESIVVDALAVVEKLRVTHPHHFETLLRVPATFQRIHYERDCPVHMVYQTPHIHLNKHGEIVKLRWSPHNQGPLQIPAEDVVPYYEAFACMANSVREDMQFQIRYKLRPGDALTLNNQRMLHGRTFIKLNGGVRELNQFSLNIDDFKSRLQVLCAKYDPDYQPKRILNHDFCFSTAAIQPGMAKKVA